MQTNPWLGTGLQDTNEVCLLIELPYVFNENPLFTSVYQLLFIFFCLCDTFVFFIIFTILKNIYRVEPIKKTY